VSATLVGALATAGALGVTHALEPDHVAGISSLTSRYGDSRLSALVGVCFSAGHVALVVVWLLVAYALLGQTAFPAILDTVGSIAVVVALGVFGALLTVRGYRVAARSHVATDHAQSDGRSLDGYRTGGHGHGHTHGDGEPHLHLPLVGSSHDHAHTTRAYLQTGLVGALFTLSPPLSMIAFLGTVVPDYGFPVAGVAVGAYAVGITLTMGAIGAGVGGLFGVSRRNGRIYGLLKLVTGVAVLALAASMVAGLLPALG
jgi:ABC-type nickel/cobalt efflux system permease component RcnA